MSLLQGEGRSEANVPVAVSFFSVHGYTLYLLPFAGRPG